MSHAADFVVIQQALVAATQTCRYHGIDFGRLGTEPSTIGLPRCDSCKQPWRVKRALDALDRLIRAEGTLRTEYGWAPDGDASDVRVAWQGADPHAAEAWVRAQARDRGGSVFVRQVTEWEQEP